MEKSKLKTIFLVGLIFISILQTGELWFGSLSSRNFFYNLWAKNSPNIIRDSDETIHLLQPRRIIVSFGVEGGAYNILNNTREEFRAATDAMTEILINAFSKGEYIREESLDWRKILSQKSILYRYSGIIPTEGLTMSQNKMISRIPRFNQILVVPDINVSQKISCYFIDEEQNKTYIAAIKQDTGELHKLIDKLKEDNTQVVYISTKQRNIKQFVNNVFLPTFNTTPVYQSISMKDPVMDEGRLDEKKLEQIVNPLFANPTLKRKQQIGDGTTYYMEGSKMVKYFPVGVIEYTDQSGSIEQNKYTSFIEAYQVAKGFLDKHQSFLNKDNLLDNPLYLSGQNKTSSGWEFYFDFTLQDIPYVFSQEILDKVDMKHAVKIIVEGSKVKLYRRLTWEGELLDKEQEINVDYLQALGEIINNLNSQGIEDIKIKDMYWAYYQKELGTSPEVYWMVNVEDKLYPIKASR